MCGIVGVYHPFGLNPEQSVVRGMADAIRHRGPDEEGFYFAPKVHLGSRRLSIIDVPAGPQPVFSEDGKSCIVFNGEVYNHAALRRELQAAGVRFRTQTDTEVVLNAYLTWGTRCLERFRGMFAFCIWNEEQEELLLVRDRFGIKPLYYVELPGGTFLMGSEIKAILAHPAVEPQIHPQAVDSLFTFGFNVAPRTFFQDIRQLPPGHFLTLSSRGKRLCAYWDLDGQTGVSTESDLELLDQFRNKLEEVVQLGMVSDVPVGVYLSGGIDSSTIASLASRLSERPLRTLSITFEEAEYDEREFSLLVANSLGARHHEFQCSVEEEDVVGMTRALENPIVSLLHLPLFLLSRKARELGLKVVLTGDGSDEIMGGYDYFQQLKCMQFMQRGGGGSWRRNILRRLYPLLQTSRQLDLMQAHLQRTGAGFPLRHPAMPYRYRAFQFKEQLYSEDFVDRLSPLLPKDMYMGNVESFRSRDLFDQAVYLETKLRLLNLTLPLADKMGMAHSIEVRPLFLDHELVELLFRIPSHLKMQGLNEKFLLKEATKGIIPEAVRLRRKQPFNPPAPWFLKSMEDLVRETLIPPRIKDAGFFEPRFVQDVVAHFYKGASPDVSGLVVVIFFVQLWYKVMVENKRKHSVREHSEFAPVAKLLAC